MVDLDRAVTWLVENSNFTNAGEDIDITVSHFISLNICS
jgi:hypothetical protein